MGAAVILRGTRVNPDDPHYERRRWWALAVLCLGMLMIVLDTTIVNVALPSIRTDLRFDDASLSWVVNAYMLTFGGSLLLGGRLGDLYGHRRLFVLGLAGFSAASLGCGLAPTQGVLVAARAVQGVAGAVVSAISLSLIMSLFASEADRAKAMGVYGFVCSAGGSIGVLLGGILTGLLSWHWIFLVNVPIGVAVAALCGRMLPADAHAAGPRRLDVPGALLVTASLMLAIFGVVGADAAGGWLAPRTLGLLGVAVLLFAAFLAQERRAARPLVPLALFRGRNLAVANLVGVLWAAAMFAWFFISALYMQAVLAWTPMQVGLAFLPSDLIMGAFSLGLSARIVTRWGWRAPLAVGLGLAAAGLALFARAPLHGEFLPDVLPGMVLLGLGGGVAFNPVLLAAMSDAAPEDAGLASGVVNTSFMLGGALGLAVLASLAAARTHGVAADGASAAQALVAGHRLAFAVGAVFAAIAAVLGGALIRERAAAPAAAEAAAP
jgi:EmrB/QacA subfamily drug resistance transporter